MSVPLAPPRLRPVVAALLAGGALAFLAAGALAPDLPFRDSMALAARFWGANRTTRLLNAPGFAREAAFARHVLDLDAAWPLASDAVLVAGPDVSRERADALLRKAAYLLAPRRVALCRGQEEGVRLLRAPGPGEEGR